MKIKLSFTSAVIAVWKPPFERWAEGAARGVICLSFHSLVGSVVSPEVNNSVIIDKLSRVEKWQMVRLNR